MSKHVVKCQVSTTLATQQMHLLYRTVFALVIPMHCGQKSDFACQPWVTKTFKLKLEIQDNLYPCCRIMQQAFTKRLPQTITKRHDPNANPNLTSIHHKSRQRGRHPNLASFTGYSTNVRPRALAKNSPSDARYLFPPNCSLRRNKQIDGYRVGVNTLAIAALGLRAYSMREIWIIFY